MKTIGILGGMSWESTLIYYKIINEETNKILGGQNNAKSVLFTVNFSEIEELQHKNKWQEATKILINACKALENASSDFIIIATNTMHKLLPEIKKHVNIPFLHIAKATANHIKKHNIKKVGLLGTKFTMLENFYKQILTDEGIEVVIPNEDNINIIHNIIYDELCLGNINMSSKQKYLNIISQMNGIEGIILGCTEIGMLISQNDLKIKVFDTTKIHAKEAVRFALQQ
jgi:aspartate racemase